jgi:hypothetical protein
MFSAVLDIRGPAPLTLAEIRTREQFAERQNASQRRADVVSECRQRGFGHVGIIANLAAPHGLRNGLLLRNGLFLGP